MGKDRIFQTEGGAFVSVRPGDHFAGGILTEAGAAEVNTTRYDVVAGGDRTTLEKMAEHYVSDQTRRGTTTKGALQIANDITADDRDIYPGRKPR